MIVMPVEGLLCSEELDLRSAPPLEDGQRFYATAISSGQPVVLISSQRHRQSVEDWLHREGFLRYAAIHHRGVTPGSWPEFKLDVLRNLTSLGSRVHFYVDADPVSVGDAAEMGIASLLVVSPGKRLGRISPEEQSFTPWDRLVDKIESRSKVRAEFQKKLLDVQGDED